MAVFVLLLCGLATTTCAQEYALPTKPAETGKAPGLQTKLLSSTSGIKTCALIFKKGDEVVSGLTEFAQKYGVKVQITKVLAMQLL